MSIGAPSVGKSKKSVKLQKGFNGASENRHNFMFSFFELHFT